MSINFHYRHLTLSEPLTITPWTCKPNLSHNWSLTDSHTFSLSCQAVLVNAILNYVEAPGESPVSYGVGLCIGLFTTEFFKAFFISLLWALNLRSAVRLKGAFSSVAFQKVISLRVHSGISMGEVKTGFQCYSWNNITSCVWESLMLL